MELRVNKDLNHEDMPDPVADRLKELQDEIDKLESRIRSNHKQERSKDI